MAADPIKDIQGKPANLFRDGSPPVYLFVGSGRFAAFHQGKWVVRATLAQLDGVLKKGGPKTVPLMLVTAPPQPHTDAIKVTSVRVAEFLSGFNYRDHDGKARYLGHCAYRLIFDQSIADALQALEVKRHAYAVEIRQEYDRIISAGREVDRHNLKSVLEGNVPPTIAKRREGK